MISDLPTYAYYHLHKMEKNHLDQVSLVFCDLTPNERATSFILSMTESDRAKLKKELKYLMLLDTA
jgi:hypothetical protein